MRMVILILLLSVFTLLAAATRPSVDRSAAVLVGKVLSTQKVTVVTNGPSKCEIWRAEVKVERIVKQDTNLTERVFLYYGHNHIAEDGVHYMEGCPGYPEMSPGTSRLFYCIRADAGDIKRVLFVPQRGWATEP
jgi:hypothetical protein